MEKQNRSVKNNAMSKDKKISELPSVDRFETIEEYCEEKEEKAKTDPSYRGYGDVDLFQMLRILQNRIIELEKNSITNKS